jgi:hypothetical protein
MGTAVLVLFMAGFLGHDAGAGEPWTGTWRLSHGKEPASELRTIERDGDIEFQLELWGGPPAYNSGLAQGHLTIRKGRASFESTEFDGRCRIDFTFTSKSVVVNQAVGDWAACGFGHSIIADGTFVRTSRQTPQFKKP